MCPKAVTCRIMNCNASYQRKEHLRRHEAQHHQQQLFQCSICNGEFGRSDTLRRHIQNVHGVKENMPGRKQACNSCRNQKAKCQGGPPCHNCVRRDIQCSLSQNFKTQLVGNPNLFPGEHMTATHHHITQANLNNSERGRHFLDLYFKVFHPHWPFIHQGSFYVDNETPLLVQSMIVIGMWVSKEQYAQSMAIDLHHLLRSSIHQQKEKWEASASEVACGTCSWPVSTYQAILLHIIFSALHKGGGVLNLDLKPSLAPADAEILHMLVASCRKLGMLYYPNMLNQYCQDDLAAYVWVSIEEVKRFNLALFHVCRAFGSSIEQQGSPENLGNKTAAKKGLCAHDLQFPSPRNDPLWKAVNKEEWESAITDDVHRLSLDDISEESWISKSATALELLVTFHSFG